MDILIGAFATFLLVLWLMVFNRHIVWASGYYFFPPLMVAIVLYTQITQIEYVIMMIVSCIIWRIMLMYFNKIFHYSLYPRYGMYMLLSSFLFLWMLSIYTYIYDIIWFLGSVQQLLVAFILIALAMIKVLQTDKTIQSRWWWLHMIWFFMLSVILEWGLFNQTLYTIIVHRSWIIIIIAILLILLFHYRWLQLKEIYRFRYLIWKNITKRLNIK